MDEFLIVLQVVGVTGADLELCKEVGKGYALFALYGLQIIVFEAGLIGILEACGEGILKFDPGSICQSPGYVFL
jgi:hypothetical protein